MGKRIRYTVFIGAVMIAAPAVRAQTMNLTGLTEREAVSIALKNNRDIINAREEVQRAGFRITEAASTAYPQINGSWTMSKNLKPQVFVISFPDSAGNLKKNRLKVGTDYNATLGANLTQLLYVGGKVGTALQAAKIYKNISANTEKNIRQNVVMGTMQTFNSALLARELRRIAGETLMQAQKHLESVEARKAAGTATEYDLLRARVNVANLRPRLLDSENSARVLLLRLKEIMGVDPESQIDITGTFSAPDTTILSHARAEIALSTRPDVNASRLTIDLYDKAVKIARGDFLPTLTAGTTFAYNGNFDQLAYHASDWNPYWFADINLSFPIFSGFRNYAKYKQAKVDYLKARTDYRKTRDSVVIEVEEGMMSFHKALKQIESQRLNVEEADRAVELAENLYTNGKATQLEVLDAQLALEVAKTNMASALYEGTIAEISLKKSIGILDADVE